MKASEYEPTTSRSEFLAKWLEEGKPGTTFSPEHVHQVALDIFATRRGQEWRGVTVLFVNEEEILTHPDRRKFSIIYSEDSSNPLSSHIDIYKKGKQVGYEIPQTGYDFDRQKNGSIWTYEYVREHGPRAVVFDNLCSEEMYRDLMRAHINTPFGSHSITS